MSDISYEELEKGDSVLFARVISRLDVFELLDLHIVSVYEDYCTGADSKTKQTFPFSRDYAEEVLFKDRKLAIEYLNNKKREIKQSNAV